MSNENDGTNKEEIENNEDNYLPQNTILFQEDKENKNEEQEEIFKSVIFTEMVKEHKKQIKQQNEKNNLKIKLKTLMNCGSCKKNLQDLFFCPFCKKNACKNCFNKHYFYLKKDYTPCPMCKKMVKKTNLKPVTLLKAIAEVVEDEDEEDASIIKFNSNQFISNCDNHKLNKIWAYCIDCDKKMCPVCYGNENTIHQEHRCVNYEKYLDLNLFFGNSFKNIKEFILRADKTISDLQKLNSELQNHKSALLSFSNDICNKIDNIYNEGQKKIDEIISSLTKNISEFNNFRKNIKKYVTKKIPKGYSEFDDMDEIKNEIIKRINEIKIEYPKTDEVNKIGKNYKKDIKFVKLTEKININKERIKNGIKTNVQYNDDYRFNMELSQDNEEVSFYLNINKFINGKENINSYLVKVIISDLYNNNLKTIYLELDKDNENKKEITFINTISKKELFNYLKKGYIYLQVDYLNLE